LKNFLVKTLPLLIFLQVILAPASVSAAVIAKYGYRVVQSYPHSTEIFTQGLEFHEGALYESAGKRGQSMVLIRRLESVTPIKSVPLENHLFGEGITVLNQRLYQLTWQAQLGFIYDASSLALTREFRIRGEGWGIANNGRQLIMSNGSNKLFVLDPTTFNVVNVIEVNHHDSPVNNLNELEWVDGVIYANIWRLDRIVIGPAGHANAACVRRSWAYYT